MAKNIYPRLYPNQGKLREIVNLRGVQRSLYNMATSSFKWDGLPDGLPSYMLERYLFDVGTAAAFIDPVGGLMILRAYPLANFNKYEVPQSVNVVGFNYNRQINIDDCVLIYNDSTHCGSWETVEEYSIIINEINQADRMNIKQLKFPWMFSGDEQTVNSVKAGIATVEQNTFALYTTPEIKKVLSDGVGFTTGVSYLGDDLKKHRDDIYNECLTLLGFDNIPITKKERLITDEAKGNNAQINFFRRDRLRNRQEAAQAINDKFGCNITVEWAGGDITGLTGKEVKTVDIE